MTPRVTVGSLWVGVFIVGVTDKNLTHGSVAFYKPWTLHLDSLLYSVIA